MSQSQPNCPKLHHFQHISPPFCPPLPTSILRRSRSNPARVNPHEAGMKRNYITVSSGISSPKDPQCTESGEQALPRALPVAVPARSRLPVPAAAGYRSAGAGFWRETRLSLGAKFEGWPRWHFSRRIAADPGRLACVHSRAQSSGSWLLFRLGSRLGSLPATPAQKTEAWLRLKESQIRRLEHRQSLQASRAVSGA
jgi:hypothetical protein